VLLDYVAHANPKSNADLKRFLRRYPEFRENIIEFTASWRALAILDKVLPPTEPNPEIDRQILQRAKAQMRRLMRRRPRAKAA
jgi:hypothetical protein